MSKWLQICLGQSCRKRILFGSVYFKKHLQDTRQNLGDFQITIFILPVPPHWQSMSGPMVMASASTQAQHDQRAGTHKDYDAGRQNHT